MTAHPHTASSAQQTRVNLDAQTQILKDYYSSQQTHFSSLSSDTSFSIGAHNVNGFNAVNKQLSFKQAILYK